MVMAVFGSGGGGGFSSMFLAVAMRRRDLKASSFVGVYEIRGTLWDRTIWGLY